MCICSPTQALIAPPARFIRCGMSQVVVVVVVVVVAAVVSVVAVDAVVAVVAAAVLGCCS